MGQASAKHVAGHRLHSWRVLRVELRKPLRRLRPGQLWQGRRHHAQLPPRDPW